MARLSIQRAETSIAVGLERARPQLLGQGEGLVVIGFGLIVLRGFALRRNLAQEVQGICLMAPFLMLAGKRQCTFGVGKRLIPMAGERQGLPEGETTERLEVSSGHRHALLERLREQRHGIGDAPG